MNHGREEENKHKKGGTQEMGRSIISCTLFFKHLKKYIYLATSGLNGSTWDVVP